MTLPWPRKLGSWVEWGDNAYAQLAGTSARADSTDDIEEIRLKAQTPPEPFPYDKVSYLKSFLRGPGASRPIAIKEANRARFGPRITSIGSFDTVFSTAILRPSRRSLESSFAMLVGTTARNALPAKSAGSQIAVDRRSWGWDKPGSGKLGDPGEPQIAGCEGDCGCATCAAKSNGLGYLVVLGALAAGAWYFLR